MSDFQERGYGGNREQRVGEVTANSSHMTPPTVEAFTLSTAHRHKHTVREAAPGFTHGMLFKIKAHKRVVVKNHISTYTLRTGEAVITQVCKLRSVNIRAFLVCIGFQHSYLGTLVSTKNCCP